MRKGVLSVNKMKNILIISQSAIRHGVKLPEGALLRVNLAWCKDLKHLEKILERFRKYKIFLDIPRGRLKPPGFKEYDMEEIAEVLQGFDNNIEYVAISNVESKQDVWVNREIFEEQKIVPKIETWLGIVNISEIIMALNYKPKVLMLDHQDLFTDLVSRGAEDNYSNIVATLVKLCEKEKVCLLRTVGVIFSAWREG